MNEPPAGGPQIVRVLPDLAAVDKTFDYRVPERWRVEGKAASLVPGTVVRVPFHGRRMRAWVIEPDPPDPHGEELSSLAGIVGAGPSREVLDVCRWAARRWAGPWCFFAATASSPRVVPASPPVSTKGASPKIATPAAGSPESAWDACFERPVAVVRVPPLQGYRPLIEAALRRPDPLLIVPRIDQASRLATHLRSEGRRTALLPTDWALAAEGAAAVVGTRSAVFGPAPGLGSVVLFDEHERHLASEMSPTWHAREVAVQRARLRGVPCVLASPVPTLEAQALGAPEEILEIGPRPGWPPLETVDLRESRFGLLTETLHQRLRDARRAVCVLNRKGRARLLACGKCSELVCCDVCKASVSEIAKGRLTCGRCAQERPRLCSLCGSMRLKTIRPGISRLAEELAALLRKPVAEVSREQKAPDGFQVLIGTEAVLDQAYDVDLVAFLDFDQELAAPRFRANEQAIALLARGARLLGSEHGRLMVQTRQVDHVVLRAVRESAPEILSEHDHDLRSRLKLAPFGSQAEISGAAAEEFIRRLGAPSGLTVSRTGEPDRWIARSSSAERLSAALSSVERPKGRVRVAVDHLDL